MSSSARLQAINAYLVGMFQSELIRLDKKASGELHKSIAAATKPQYKTVFVDIEALHYAWYVNAGRKPGKKGVPISALVPWIGHRGIELNGRSAESVAFLIQRSIKIKGIKAAPFIDNVIARVEKNKSLDNLIVKYYDEAIDEQIGDSF
ncbi:MAG: hypothetical protein R3Y68_09045 [Rikenellaceae bacterium]